MKKIVTKFGGSSLADAGQFRKVKDILLLDEARQYVIPSAPGRRFKDDAATSRSRRARTIRIRLT